MVARYGLVADVPRSMMVVSSSVVCATMITPPLPSSYAFTDALAMNGCARSRRSDSLRRRSSHACPGSTIRNRRTISGFVLVWIELRIPMGDSHHLPCRG